MLVRDPRDATVSWTYHLRAQPGMRHYNSVIQHLPRDYDDWTHAAQLAFQVRTFLPAAVNWIEGWVDAASAHDLAVHIVTFDALRTDAARTIAAMLDFHGVAGLRPCEDQAAEAGRAPFPRRPERDMGDRVQRRRSGIFRSTDRRPPQAAVRRAGV